MASGRQFRRLSLFAGCRFSVCCLGLGGGFSVEGAVAPDGVVVVGEGIQLLLQLPERLGSGSHYFDRCRADLTRSPVTIDLQKSPGPSVSNP
jgi:hypothetical protein